MTDARLLRLIGDTTELSGTGEFYRRLIRALQDAVPAVWVAVNDIGADAASITVLIEPELDRAALALFTDLAYQNPLIQRYETTRDGRTLRMSDVVSREDFHALQIYQRFYRPLGVEYQLAFTLPHVKNRILGVVMTRQHEDFSVDEVELIEAARPFLIQAYRNATQHDELLTPLRRHQRRPDAASARFTPGARTDPPAGPGTPAPLNRRSGA